MLRNTAAIVAGILTAFVTVVVIEQLGHFIYPPPEGVDFSDPDAIRLYLATLPFGAFMFVFASSVIAAFVGTLIGCYIGTAHPILFGAVVGGLILAATIANFIFVPHPLWLSVATVTGIVLSTMLAIRLAPPTNSPPPEPFADDSDSG